MVGRQGRNRGPADLPRLLRQAGDAPLRRSPLVLVAAFAHAGWNALSKRAPGGAAFVWTQTVVGSVCMLPVARRGMLARRRRARLARHRR